jgi:PleD family two-component response regulator
MGCEIFVIDLSYLISSLRSKKEWDVAVTRAKQIADGFSGFCERVTSAKTTSAPEVPRGNMPLGEYIDLLDKDSANRKLSVMAIDDSPDILKAIYLVLKNDYKVFPVSDPTQIDEMLKHVTPDLFLLDYKMPRLDGLDVISIIRGLKEHKDTPVVFLTAEGNIDRKSAAVLLGSCDFLEKPIETDKLIETITKHISG